MFFNLFLVGMFRSLNDYREVEDVKRLVKCTFCFEDTRLEELKELSKKSGVPQAIFVREALSYILKKYRYLTKMEKFNSEQARYLLSGSRGVDAEERPLLRIPFSPMEKRKGDV